MAVLAEMIVVGRTKDIQLPASQIDSEDGLRIRQIASVPDPSYDVFGVFNFWLHLGLMKRITRRQPDCSLTFSDRRVELAALCEEPTPSLMGIRTLWFPCDRIIGVL